MNDRELHAFVWGIAAGLGIIVACFVLVSELAGVRWQPVKIGATDAELATKPYPAAACSNYPASGITLPACPQ